MGRLLESPLDELDQTALYKLLGEAWYAQFKPETGGAYELGSSAEIGKREFDALVPMLREDLCRPCIYGVIACVSKVLQRSGSWRMPAAVVAVLAAQRKLIPSNVLQFAERKPNPGLGSRAAPPVLDQAL